MTPATVLTVALALVFFVALCFVFAAVNNISMAAQLQLSVSMLVVCFILWCFKNSEFVRLTLMFLSMFGAIRYILWRATHTLNFSTLGDGFISVALFLAEGYTVYTLVGFFFQTLSLDRSTDDIPSDPTFVPWVDIFIPTYNESVDILRRTATGALYVNYPNKKVYILDDGKRAEMKALADELGCHYIAREKNLHAKAGNINNALQESDGELILILDADHIPVRTILERMVHFFKDPLVSLVQSPHRFINPGPIERNMYLTGKLPGEQELFFQIVQLGNDLWNATFFCGSAAMLRRSVLMEIGGIATETVTEDCHTSLRMHALGYKSKYLSVPQIAGLSPESLGGFVIQHTRWARGAIQMFRLEFPIFKKGLTLSQRLCYHNGMIHFFFGLPRIVFYLAPVGFLVFNLHPIRVSFPDYAIMASTFIVCALLTNQYFFKNFRHSFWSDVYEAILAPYYAYVSTLALLDPRAGKFNVTPKGTQTDNIYFDFDVAKPNIVIFGILVFALLFGVVRFFSSHSPMEKLAICINIGWLLYNMNILAIAILCALEHTFTRRAHRVRTKINLALRLPHRNASATTVTVTEFGCLARLKEQDVSEIVIANVVDVLVETTSGELVVPAEIRFIEEQEKGAILLGLQFLSEDPVVLQELIRTVYCNPEICKHLYEPDDSLLLSFWQVLSSPYRVAVNTVEALKAARKTKEVSQMHGEKDPA